MILIAETVHPGDIHAAVNSAFLSLVRLTLPECPMLLIAEEKHVQAIQAFRPEADKLIAFSTFIFPRVSRLFFWPFKIAGEWGRILSVIRKARRHKPELLVWTALFPTGLWFLQLLSPLLMKQQQQLILLHGELEYFNTTMKRPVERILRFFLRKGLNLASSRIKFIVFADSIKEALSQQDLRCMEQIYVLPHPYDYDAGDLAKKKELHDETAVMDDKKMRPLVAGTFGVMQLHKNAHFFFRLAERMNDVIQSGGIVFHAAGKCDPAVRVYNQGGWVNLHQPDAFLPREDFEDIVSGFDLALFFYDNNAYQFCASGAVHEAIRLGIPVLALRNNYFEWLIQHRGEIGILFDSIDRLEAFIREVVDGSHRHRLNEVRKNCIRFRQEYSLQQQSQQLKNILADNTLSH